MTHSLPAEVGPVAEGRLDAGAIHEAHAEFVWASLHRLGVREPDLPDMLQEVFVVVHRRLDSYDGVSRLTTWLFGICMRVAAAYRRRAHRRYEHPIEPVEALLETSHPNPEEQAATRQARAQLEHILDSLDVEKRAVFVMFEIDQMPCAQIAEVMGVPVGTVHSRLHAARAQFAAAVQRARKRGGGTP